MAVEERYKILAIGQTISDRLRSAWLALAGDKPRGTYEWSPRLDGIRKALTHKLTFDKLEAFLRRGDNGDLAETLQLFEEMEDRDCRLKSVAQKRRMALTGLDYEIVSAAESNQTIDRSQADDEAAFVRDTLAGIDSFAGALEHLAEGIGPNLAVVETLWDPDRLVPIGFVDVPSSRLTMDLTQSPSVRVTTEEDARGKEAVAPQWIVHIPHARSGSPLMHSLFAAQATIWLIKKIAVANWHTFCEIFGMPIRVGKFDQQSAGEDEKKLLKEMLANIGSSAWAMISRATEIEFTETSQRGTAPFEGLINYCDREQAISWTGGNLTTDTTGGTGTFAAAESQMEIRADLRDDDIKRESRTLGQQLIRQMVTFRRPNRTGPIPIFRRIKPETVDRTAEATLMKAAQGIGIAVPRKWAYDRLSIPEPKTDDEILEPADAFTQGLNEGAAGDPLDLPAGNKATRQQGNKSQGNDDDGDES